MQTMAAISGAKLIQRAVRGDASSRNEKSGNLASCLLVRGVLFRPLAIRYDVFPGHRGATRRAVRKHGAPNGALRLDFVALVTLPLIVRKHRAPKGALRRDRHLIHPLTPITSESTEHQKVH